MNTQDIISDWLSIKSNRDKVPTFEMTKAEFYNINLWANTHYYPDEQITIYEMNSVVFKVKSKEDGSYF